MSAAGVLRFGLLVLGAAVLLVLFAGWRPGMPWQPQRVLEIDPLRWQGQGATVRRDGDAVHVSGATAEGASLIVQALSAFDTADYRYLQLRTTGPDGDRRGYLLLQTESGNRSIQLPGHPAGALSVDLGAQKDWQGRVQALGLVMQPTDYIAGHLAPAPHYVLGAMRFESANLRAALAALADRWYAYRPWNGRSNHTGGFEHGADPGPSLQGFVAALLGWWIVLLWATRHPRRMQAARAAVLAGVAVLAIQLGGQLALRAAVAVSSARLAAGHPEWPPSAMPAMANEAAGLLDDWASAPPPRVLVWGNDNFTREYPVWLLRAHNVAWLVVPAQLSLLAQPEPGSVLVLGGRSGWTYDPARGELQLGETRLPAQPRQQGAWLHVFAIGAQGATP
jgi:hypothetical protein